MLCRYWVFAQLRTLEGTLVTPLLLCVLHLSSFTSLVVIKMLQRRAICSGVSRYKLQAAKIDYSTWSLVFQSNRQLSRFLKSQNRLINGTTEVVPISFNLPLSGVFLLRERRWTYAYFLSLFSASLGRDYLRVVGCQPLVYCSGESVSLYLLFNCALKYRLLFIAFIFEQL